MCETVSRSTENRLAVPRVSGTQGLVRLHLIEVLFPYGYILLALDTLERLPVDSGQMAAAKLHSLELWIFSC